MVISSLQLQKLLKQHVMHQAWHNEEKGVNAFVDYGGALSPAAAESHEVKWR
jgi:hypothetical protein